MGNGKKYILKGDTTTHGGTVLTAWGEDCPDAKWTIDGRPVAFVGDLVSCPVCGGVHPILKGPQDPPIDFCGKAPALEEWKTGCGAGLKSRMQSHATHTDEGEAARKAAENAAMAAAFVERMAKRQEQAAAQLRAIMEGRDEGEEKWIAFELGKEGCYEGLECVAYFDDGSEMNGTFDAENRVTFNNVSGDKATRVELIIENPQPVSSITEALLKKLEI